MSGSDDWPVKHGIVVVPFDFTAASRRALRTASKFVSDPHHLHVLHVAPSLQPTQPGVVWAEYDEHEVTQKAEAALREAHAEEGLPHAVPVTRLGHPADAIVDHAREVDAELVVMPSHRRRGLSRFLLGSVTERVLRLGHCPVLVLRGLPEDLV